MSIAPMGMDLMGSGPMGSGSDDDTPGDPPPERKSYSPVIRTGLVPTGSSVAITHNSPHSDSTLVARRRRVQRRLSGKMFGDDPPDGACCGGMFDCCCCRRYCVCCKDSCSGRWFVWWKLRVCWCLRRSAYKNLREFSEKLTYKEFLVARLPHKVIAADSKHRHPEAATGGAADRDNSCDDGSGPEYDKFGERMSHSLLLYCVLLFGLILLVARFIWSHTYDDYSYDWLYVLLCFVGGSICTALFYVLFYSERDPIGERCCQRVSTNAFYFFLEPFLVITGIWYGKGHFMKCNLSKRHPSRVAMSNGDTFDSEAAVSERDNGPAVSTDTKRITSARDGQQGPRSNRLSSDSENAALRRQSSDILLKEEQAMERSPSTDNVDEASDRCVQSRGCRYALCSFTVFNFCVTIVVLILGIIMHIHWLTLSKSDSLYDGTTLHRVGMRLGFIILSLVTYIWCAVHMHSKISFHPQGMPKPESNGLLHRNTWEGYLQNQYILAYDLGYDTRFLYFVFLFPAGAAAFVVLFMTYIYQIRHLDISPWGRTDLSLVVGKILNWIPYGGSIWGSETTAINMLVVLSIALAALDAFIVLESLSSYKTAIEAMMDDLEKLAKRYERGLFLTSRHHGVCANFKEEAGHLNLRIEYAAVRKCKKRVARAAGEEYDGGSARITNKMISAECKAIWREVKLHGWGLQKLCSEVLRARNCVEGVVWDCRVLVRGHCEKFQPFVLLGVIWLVYGSVHLFTAVILEHFNSKATIGKNKTGEWVGICVTMAMLLMIILALTLEAGCSFIMSSFAKYFHQMEYYHLRRLHTVPIGDSLAWYRSLDLTANVYGVPITYQSMWVIFSALGTLIAVLSRTFDQEQL